MPYTFQKAKQKNFFKLSDKIYEARHELLKLTTPLMKAAIPPNYFSKLDLNDEFAFRQTLALQTLQPNRTESPLTHPHFGQNFGPSFEAIQNVLTANMAARMPNLQNNRQRLSQANFHNNNLLSPHSNLSPRNSMSPITSGYNSAHNSFNSSGSGSLEAQMNYMQQPQNPFLDSTTDTNAYYDDQKTPTLLDVKVMI